MEVEKILIRGPNWVGDAVLAIPAMKAVREHFPHAEITLLVRPWVAGLFTSAQFVDKVWREEHLAHCLRRVRREIEDSTFRAFRAYVIEARPTEEVCRKFKMTRNQVHLIKWRVTNRLRDHMRALLGEDSMDA